MATMLVFIAMALAVFSPALATRNVSLDFSSLFVQRWPAESWFQAKDAGGSSFMFSNSSGAVVTIQFPQPAIAFYWIGYRTSSPSLYKICIDCTSQGDDGALVYGPQTRGQEVPVLLYSITDLPTINHSITIRNGIVNPHGIAGEINIHSFLFTTHDTVPYPSDWSLPGSSLVEAVLVPSIVQPRVAIVSQGTGSVSFMALMSVVFSFILRRKRQGSKSKGRNPVSAGGYAYVDDEVVDTSNRSITQVLDLTSPPISPPGSTSTSNPPSSPSHYGPSSPNSGTSSQRARNPKITVTSPTTVSSMSAYSTSSAPTHGEVSYYETPYFQTVDEETPEEISNDVRPTTEFPPSLPPHEVVGYPSSQEALELRSEEKKFIPHPPLRASPSNAKTGRFRRLRSFADKLKRGTLPPLPDERVVHVEPTLDISRSTVEPIVPATPHPPRAPQISIPMFEIYRPPPGQPQPTSPSDSELSALSPTRQVSLAFPLPPIITLSQPPNATNTTELQLDTSMAALSAHRSVATAQVQPHDQKNRPVTELMELIHLCSPSSASIDGSSPSTESLPASTPSSLSPPHAPRASKTEFFVPFPPKLIGPPVFPPSPEDGPTVTLPLRIKTPPSTRTPPPSTNTLPPSTNTLPPSTNTPPLSTGTPPPTGPMTNASMNGSASALKHFEPILTHVRQNSGGSISFGPRTQRSLHGPRPQPGSISRGGRLPIVGKSAGGASEVGHA